MLPKWTAAIERTIFAFIWKYSKREQLVLLLVTLLLFPLLFLTLELPKRIINDAIGADTAVVDVIGFQISQITFLFLLSCLFLMAVLVHGLVKMRVNTMKGVLSERLLRRLRYTMIGRILRFPAPYFERTSQGELVSMVTSESEPMGGLMGDALAQPVLQAGQMLTILGFLFYQSFSFGLAASALIPLQAWLVPKLQRKINILNKQRVQQIRALAAEIGEGASGAAALRTSGGTRFHMALISDRLGRLYFIRFEIFKRKFFLKFINNFITQITPFFFYAFGGYLTIKGEVSVGALVAALSSYKELSSPWKELLTYYNQTQDMAVRWEAIAERFSPDGMVDEALFAGKPDKIPTLNGDIELIDVTVRDKGGSAVLEDLNLTIPAGKITAITAPSDEGRRALAELLIREVTPTSGKIMLSGLELGELHQTVISTRIGHATSRPVMFMGSFGDNVLLPLKRPPYPDTADTIALKEALRSGNSVDALNADWLDPSQTGQGSPEALREWWLDLVEGMGHGNALFQRGLDQKFDPENHPELAVQLTALRDAAAQDLEAAGLLQYAHLFDEDAYNPMLPVGDNLMFAAPKVPITATLLADHPDFMKLLAEFDIDQDLLRLAVDVVELLRQTFGLDGMDHPLFRKLGLDVASYETATDLVEKMRRGTTLDAKEQAKLIVVPFVISAEQIGSAFPEDMKTRVLAMRGEHMQTVQERMGDLFTPFRSDQYLPSMSVLENVLFGKISGSAGSKGDELRNTIADKLIEAGIDRLIPGLIFDTPIALGGSNLRADFAEMLSVSRATIKRPDILVLDSVMASYSTDTRAALFAKIREILPDTTIIHLNASHEEPRGSDAHFELVQRRFTNENAQHPVGTDSAVSTDLARKLEALKKTNLFSNLNHKQLRLLAFGARWYSAKAGAYVFHKDDDPTDGAYLIIQGQAELLLPHSDGDDKIVATVEVGELVGELGLIRNVPRALDMRAKTDLDCLRIGAEEFLSVVEHDPALAFKLLQVVAGYVPN